MSYISKLLVTLLAINATSLQAEENVALAVSKGSNPQLIYMKETIFSSDQLCEFDYLDSFFGGNSGNFDRPSPRFERYNDERFQRSTDEWIFINVRRFSSKSASGSFIGENALSYQMEGYCTNRYWFFGSNGFSIHENRLSNLYFIQSGPHPWGPHPSSFERKLFEMEERVIAGRDLVEVEVEVDYKLILTEGVDRTPRHSGTKYYIDILKLGDHGRWERVKRKKIKGIPENGGLQWNEADTIMSTYEVSPVITERLDALVPNDTHVKAVLVGDAPMADFVDGNRWGITLDDMRFSVETCVPDQASDVIPAPCL